MQHSLESCVLKMAEAEDKRNWTSVSFPEREVPVGQEHHFGFYMSKKYTLGLPWWRSG